MTSTTIATEGKYKLPSSNHSPKYNGPYIAEDPEVITARKALADFHVSQGKSFKYAWWLAFQQFPRERIPVGTPETPSPSPTSSTP